MSGDVVGSEGSARPHWCPRGGGTGAQAVQADRALAAFAAEGKDRKEIRSRSPCAGALAAKTTWRLGTRVLLQDVLHNFPLFCNFRELRREEKSCFSCAPAAASPRLTQPHVPLWLLSPLHNPLSCPLSEAPARYTMVPDPPVPSFPCAGLWLWGRLCFRRCPTHSFHWCLSNTPVNPRGRQPQLAAGATRAGGGCWLPVRPVLPAGPKDGFRLRTGSGSQGRAPVPAAKGHRQHVPPDVWSRGQPLSLSAGGWPCGCFAGPLTAPPGHMRGPACRHRPRGMCLPLARGSPASQPSCIHRTGRAGAGITSPAFPCGAFHLLLRQRAQMFGSDLTIAVLDPSLKKPTLERPRPGKALLGMSARSRNGPGGDMSSGWTDVNQ